MILCFSLNYHIKERIHTLMETNILDIDMINENNEQQFSEFIYSTQASQ